MDGHPERQTRTVRDVIREAVRTHVEAVMAANRGVPQYRLAYELGWTVNTLKRHLREWASEGGESLIQDRR